MRRKRLYQILIFLLCLSPVLSQAQMLTQYEYWFDDDFSTRKALRLSGYEADIDVGIDARSLGNGLHKFCLRVKQSDGMYSPVTTGYFFTAQVSDGGKLEYWFDGNQSGSKTVDGHVSSDGEAFLFNTGLDLNAVSPGYHSMFYRFVNDNGTTTSAVSKASIFVKPNLSDGGKLECWFDDDRENVYTVAGKVSSDGEALIFNSDLDLKAVSEGNHRMYYRLVDAKGKPNSAVSMTPIMVKSRYVTEAKTSKVVSYSVSVDNQEPVVHDVLNPSDVIMIPYTYDARGMSMGKHTIKTKVWNSLGAVSIDKTDFNVVALETPTIMVEATEKNGMVTIGFNSIPNDLRYRVFRKDENGTNLRIGSFETSYPNALVKNDEPVEGTYNYFVQAIYTDYNGKQQSILSNEVSVTVSKTQTPADVAANTGTIIGRIIIDNQQVAFMPLDLSMDITFSDGVTVRSQSTGMFIREGVPVGTKLSMTVKNNQNYTFDSPSVTVDKDTRNKIQVINATPIKNQVVEKSNESYDLVINSTITGIPNSFDFKVKNMSDQLWSGEIDIMGIKKNDDKKSETSDDLKSGQTVSYSALNTFQRFGTYSIDRLKQGDTKDVSIPLTNLPTVSKDTYYQLYIVSKPSGSQANAYKLLESVSSEVLNPKEMLVEAASGHDYSDFAEDEVNACIAEVLSTMKALDKVGGPMSKALEKASDALTRYEKNKEIDDLFGNLPELLQDFSTGLKEGIKDVKNYTDYLGKVKNFYDKVNKAKEIANADDFTKFYELSKLVIDMSGDPFGKVYMVYLDVAKKAAEKILELSKKVYEYHAANSFFNGYTRFEIKVEKNSPLWIENDLYQGSNVAKRIEKVNVYCYCILGNGTLIKNARTYLPDMSSSGRSCKLIDMGFLKDANGEEIKEDPDMEKVNRYWMEIEWKSGRKSIAPLLYDEVAELTNRGQQDRTYTVTFKSGVSDKDRMDYKIKLKCKDKSLNE